MRQPALRVLLLTALALFPSPTFSPSSRQQLCFSLHWMPAPVGQLLYFTTVFFKVLYCKIKNVLLLVCFLCIICVGSTYTPITRVCVSVHACAQLLSCVWLFVTPRTVAHQASLSMEFSRPRILEWAAIPFSMGSSQPRDQTRVSWSPALQVDYYRVNSVNWVPRPTLLDIQTNWI